MKKISLSILILVSFLIIFNAADDKKNNYDANKVKDLISKLGGGAPKKTMKFFDGSLMDMNGKKVKLSDFSGKVILLNLWATWCPPCRAEMPSIEKLHKEYSNKNFMIVAVSQGENLDTVKKFVKGTYSFPIFVDINNEISKNYSSGSIPTTYIIDKEGYILAGFVGGREWDSKEVKELINELLK
jgi:thiol-disulfide isomerase/thioredoxin